MGEWLRKLLDSLSPRQLEFFVEKLAAPNYYKDPEGPFQFMRVCYRASYDLSTEVCIWIDQGNFIETGEYRYGMELFTWSGF